jgi:hypothetical protein
MERHALMVSVYTETAQYATQGTVNIVLPRFAKHQQKAKNMVFALQFRLVVPAMILCSALQLLVAFNALQTSALSKLGSTAPTLILVLRIIALQTSALFKLDSPAPTPLTV